MVDPDESGDGKPQPRDRKPPRPHENAMRALLVDEALVLELLREQLPNDIAGLLDLATPAVHIDGTYVDEALYDSWSDFLYEVRLKDGGPAFIYVLIEHKSDPRLTTPLQLAAYMVRIWTRHAQDKAERLRALPPIVPFVLYHGEENWSVPDGIGTMIASPDPALVFLPGERFVFRNLRGMSADALSRNPVLRSGFLALTDRAMTHVDMFTEGLVEAGDMVQDQIVEYIFRIYPGTDLQPLYEALQDDRRKPLEEKVITIAERLKQEGLQIGKVLGLEEGEARGLEKGKVLGLEEGEALGLEKGTARSLSRLLVNRFGPLPDDVAARIAAADTGQLEVWFDAALDAATREAVFRSDSAH